MKNKTVCQSCYNKNTRENSSSEKETCASHHQPKTDKNYNIDNNPGVSAYENHRHVVIDPSNVGKNYYMLKILEKIGKKDTFI